MFFASNPSYDLVVLILPPLIIKSLSECIPSSLLLILNSPLLIVINLVEFNESFEELKEEPMGVLSECLGLMKPSKIDELIFYNRDIFPPIFVETCIINLPEWMQANAIVKYQEFLDH